jgi:hypothetical protein
MTFLLREQMDTTRLAQAKPRGWLDFEENVVEEWI